MLKKEIDAVNPNEEKPIRNFDNNFNIMIIDDKSDNRDLIWENLKNICEEEGLYKPTKGQAEDGYKAIKFLTEAAKKGWIPDVFCVDINMPVMDGFAFCSAIKKYPEFQDVPVIFFSDLLDEKTHNDILTHKNREKAFQSGVIQAYDKSFDRTSLKSLTNLLKFIHTNKELKEAKKIQEKQNMELLKMNKVLEEEIELARTVLCYINPHESPVIDNILIDFIFNPMTVVGGDLLDIYYNLEYKDKMGIFICDVSGHGLHAAVLSAMIKMSLNSWSTFFTQCTPAKALDMMKEQLKGKLGKNHFTAYIGYLDLQTGVFEFARAGHPPILIIRNSQDIEIINSRGRLVTDDPKWEIAAENVSIKLNKGDKVILYTDGLIEVKNPIGEILGIELNNELAYKKNNDYSSSKFINWLKQNINISAPPDILCKNIRQKVYEFAGGDALDDDLTVVVFEYNPH